MHARDLRLLFLFAEIVRAGSIRGAAAALSLSPPVLSTALRDLEAVIGATLIRRTTRRLDLTEIGTQVFERAEAMRSHAGAALNVAAADRAVSGTLRLSAPVELATAWLPPLLANYRHRWPEVLVSVEATDMARGPTDGIDLAVRATFCRSATEAAALKPAPCTILPVDLVCAPDHASTGTLAQRLTHAGYIAAGSNTTVTIPAHAADGGVEDVSVPVTCIADDRLTTRALALQGLGAVRLIRDTVEQDIREGRLIRLAPDLDFGVVGIRLLATDPQPAPAVLAFQRMMSEVHAQPV